MYLFNDNNKTWKRYRLKHGDLLILHKKDGTISCKRDNTKLYSDDCRLVWRNHSSDDKLFFSELLDAIKVSPAHQKSMFIAMAELFAQSIELAGVKIKEEKLLIYAIL